MQQKLFRSGRGNHHPAHHCLVPGHQLQLRHQPHRQWLRLQRLQRLRLRHRLQRLRLRLLKSTAPPGGTAGEILVVDDDPGILYLLEKLRYYDDYVKNGNYINDTCFRY